MIECRRNLHVKNLSAAVGDDMLRKKYAGFFKITSAKVMPENGRSKKFGFVWFSRPEEASKAMKALNGKHC